MSPKSSVYVNPEVRRLQEDLLVQAVITWCLGVPFGAYLFVVTVVSVSAWPLCVERLGAGS